MLHQSPNCLLEKQQDSLSGPVRSLLGLLSFLFSFDPSAPPRMRYILLSHGHSLSRAKDHTNPLAKGTPEARGTRETSKRTENL